jgi:hypothetical protein
MAKRGAWARGFVAALPQRVYTAEEIAEFDRREAERVARDGRIAEFKALGIPLVTWSNDDPPAYVAGRTHYRFYVNGIEEWVAHNSARMHELRAIWEQYRDAWARVVEQQKAALDA